MSRVLDSWTPGLKIRRRVLSCRCVWAPESLCSASSKVWCFIMFLLGVYCIGPSVNTGPLYQSSVRTLWRSLRERATSLTLQVGVSCPFRSCREGGGEGKVGKGLALLCLGRWIRVEVLESMDERMVNLKYIWTKKMVTEKVQGTCLHLMEPFKEITNVNEELFMNIFPSKGIKPQQTILKLQK